MLQTSITAVHSSHKHMLSKSHLIHVRDHIYSNIKQIESTSMVKYYCDYHYYNLNIFYNFLPTIFIFLDILHIVFNPCVIIIIVLMIIYII